MSNLHPLIEQQLALAGIVQAALLVQQIARTGTCDEQAFEASISSICVTEPDTPQQVFGQLSNLKIGFTGIAGQLSNKAVAKDAEITRYISSMLGLERKLAAKPSVYDDLGVRINNVQRQLSHVEFEHHQILSSLASIYVDVVSPLAPKIQIAGNPAHLQQESHQHKVRALLLAGVRAAVMWRQMGGKRRHILFNRKRILRSANLALQEIH